MLTIEQFTEKVNRDEVEKLKTTSLEDFWVELGGRREQFDSNNATFYRDNLLAKHEELARLSREEHKDLAALIDELSDSKKTKQRLASFRVWQALWQASTPDTVNRACEEWNRLPRRYRDQSVSSLVAAHAQSFVDMKDDARFPRSKWADEARITYLARGMAGLLLGISPLTAIERLRKVTHKRGHPLFVKDLPGYPFAPIEVGMPSRNWKCVCWRCVLKRKTEQGLVPY